MKKCNRCHILKEDSEFAYRNKAKDKLQPYCKECKKEIDRERYLNNTNNRRDKIKNRQKKTQQSLKKYLNDIKKHSKCAICGESRW